MTLVAATTRVEGEKRIQQKQFTVKHVKYLLVKLHHLKVTPFTNLPLCHNKYSKIETLRFGIIS